MMGPTFLLMLVGLLASAFFSGIETGIISIHRLRLRHAVRQGSRGTGILEAFINDFDRLLGTTLVGNNICLVVISIAASSMADASGTPGATALAPLVTSALVVVFGEYLPKAWFQARPIERCRRFASLLLATDYLFRPLSVSVIAVARILTPGNGGSTFSPPTPFVTRDDLKVLAREGEKDGVLSSSERFMIHRVIELSGVTAANLMVSREQMTTVPDDLPAPEILALARQSGFTRFPCVNRRTGTFTGIVNIFDVLSAGPEASGPASAFARLPAFIPATLQADRILPQMRRGGHPMCLVRKADAVVGLVTAEDILRVIVGKL